MDEEALRKGLLEWRELLASEKGTEPPCPFCHRPRVKRSDYVRCNPCATNWLEGEDLSRDPREGRKRAWLATKGIARTRTESSDGVQTAETPIEER